MQEASERQQALPLDDAVVAGLLAGPNLARLAYIGCNGRPHVVPIWFAHIDGEIVMVTGPKADKVRALEANGAVAITIDSSTPPYHVLLVDGDATVEHTDGMAAEYPAIVKRYLGAAAEGYLAPMRGRVRTQRRIRVRVRSWRVLDFQTRFPKSLR
ncbi:MAG: pyridoxamine 5'-phosphate oxidase family protein [Dehalococcoidia bacterium]|nr:pyridoxamine 5'-phosphate oxidase family protein [Dehalococcoidia bacterium]